MKELINKEILQEIITDCLIERISKETINNYKSPIWDIVNWVISNNSEEIKLLLQEMLSDVLKDNNFKKILKEEFTRKVAKNLIWKLEWAVDLYKADKGIKSDKKSKKDKGAAEAVSAKNARSAPQADESSTYLRESQVQKMSSKEYEKYSDEIMEANRTGKFIYDLSGSAR